LTDVVEKGARDFRRLQGSWRAPSPAIRSAANEPNTGFVVPLLKPFADRSRAADMAQSLIGRVFAEGQQIRSANVIAFNLPPIRSASICGRPPNVATADRVKRF
jgi:hypothetical protein